ncbi:phosphate regulon sensor histidine kinase PhoR [Methylomicrobium sp. Wu6]|uniref:phosphate regulon sensor histidine kinase PhoR n=1 Tax=Methylomicrobium sp. Wu6 TaxID=3107928 RepID=UPI002DD6A9BE|nr:phosphate regulon sensor histidine kinase PhoR [Methylomicrobium sp. Wu6]MEC4747211.1 phosphate regulon sensor histidine kinase PhoR [Methylomicrobium sp. Wu6]
MSIWQREITIALLSLFAVAVIGGLTGYWLPMLLAVALIFLCRQIYQINRFERWIRVGGKGGYPNTKGIWEEIYYHVYRIKKNDKRRKKKLGKMIDQFRQSTEALPDAAVVLGSDDEIEWANKAALNVLGLQQSDKGQRILNLLRYPEFVRYFDAKDFRDAIILPSPVDANIILAVRIVSYGAGLRLLLAQDVTQLKQMERMRKDFVANVSHELRTPLTVLKGYIETLQDLDDGGSALLTGSLEQMRGQTERMQHLVDDLLMLTRLETQQRRTLCVDMPALLKQICSEGGGVENSSGHIELSLESEVNIHGDEQELRSAFTNLLGNALKYSPADSVVNVRWFQDGDTAVLEVQDRGIGIAAADIPRVTERFYRAESHHGRKTPGTGLGLAIVKHVLLRHDARLHIISELGKGSCFSCHFPANRLCD